MESNPNPKNSSKTETKSELVQGRDYYFDEGLMVLTSHFLKERGYCCSNQCRHCPYGEICDVSADEVPGESLVLDKEDFKSCE